MRPEPSLRTPILRGEWIFLLITLLVALVLRLVLITHHGLTSTDLITWDVLHLSPSEIIQERLAKNHVPLYFLALKGWTSIFGLSEISLRIPSIIVGLGCIAALWWVGRMLFSPAVGMTAAVIGTFHQMWVFTSLEIRLYGPLILFTLIAMGGFLLWQESRKWQYALLYVSAMILGLATQLLIITLVVSLLGHWLISLRPTEKRGKWWQAPLLLLSPLVVLTPLFIAWLNVQDKVGGDEFEIHSPGRIWRNLVRVAYGDYEFLGEVGKDIIRPITVPLMAITIIIAIVWMVKQRQSATLGKNPRRSFALIAWVMVPPPIGLYIAAMISGSMIGMVRYLSLSTALAPIGIAAAWWGFKKWGVRAIGFTLTMLAIVIQTAFFIGSPGEGIRDALEFIASEAGPRHRALACSAGGSALGFDYYNIPMDCHYLDRDIDDPDTIRAAAQRAIGDDGDRLYLFLYHSNRSPAPRILRQETPWIELEREEEFGNSEVWVFRVLSLDGDLIADMEEQGTGDVQ